MSWQTDICEEFGGKFAVKKLERAVLDILQEMIDAGCDVNEKVWDGSPIWSKLLEDSEVPASIIRLMLDKGANLHADTDEPFLFKALNTGMKPDVIAILIQYGADASYISEEDHETALQIACESSEYGVETIKLLLEHGCPINTKNLDSGCSALHNAADNHLSSSVIEFLIKNGADIDAKDEDGNTPLMKLCSNMLLELENARLLIKAGADISHKNDEEYSALGIICKHVGNAELVELLVEQGLDVNATENGFTYPLLAAEERNWDAVDKLFSLGFSKYMVRHPDTGETLQEIIEDNIDGWYNQETIDRIKEVMSHWR